MKFYALIALLFFPATIACKTFLSESKTLDATPTLADLVFEGGGVYTVSERGKWAEAVAVQSGKIVFVGNSSGLGPWIGPKTRRIDLRGKMLLPSFHDAHVHLADGGIELSECNLKELTSMTEIVSAIKKFATANPDKKWIRGGGWPLTLSNGNPNKSVLDQIVPDRPVILTSFDGHSAWVNSKALRLAQITKNTPDPPGGRIERDQVTNEPTGTLREDAINLVFEKAPSYTHKDYVAGLRRGLQMANQFGITSVQEAHVTEQHLDAFKQLDDAGELTVRTVAAMGIDSEAGISRQITQLVHWRKIYAGQRIRATAAKIFQDGVIESKTAALLKPYLNSGNERGLLYLEPEKLNRYIRDLDANKFQVHIHAIGDRAIQTSLDAFENARKVNGTRDSRHQIAHIQLFDPADVGRFDALGVIANFQPLWANADPYIVGMTIPFLGPERSRWLYPIGSVVKSGAKIACGSDWTVSSMNPLEAIQVALTRRAPTEGAGPAWIKEETIDLPTAIACYTINGAYANFEESATGSIDVGKAADLVVLDKNLFDLPIHKIHDAKVLLTLLEGEKVYREQAYSDGLK